MSYRRNMTARILGCVAALALTAGLPGCSVFGDTPMPTPTPAATASTGNALNGCSTPALTVDLMNYISEHVDDEFFSVGYVARAGWGDVVAIQVPTFTGLKPTGTRSFVVHTAGTAGDSSAAERNALACLDAVGYSMPEKPSLKCEKAPLDKIPLAKGPLSASLGGKAVASAAVRAERYQLVAVRLDSGDVSTRVWEEASGLGAPASPEWRGGGTPDRSSVVWGPAARAAAVSCL